MPSFRPKERIENEPTNPPTTEQKPKEEPTDTITTTDTTTIDDYVRKVIKLWDNASAVFTEICTTYNRWTSHIKNWYLTKSKNSPFETPAGLNWITHTAETTDGVWTKVEIYTDEFNNLIYILEKGETTEEVHKIAVELWERILHDLIAMNADDLRNGEMATAVTNIIDINHLEGKYWEMFTKSMAEAMGKVIQELDIAITAGETAILWEPTKVEQYAKTINALMELLEAWHKREESLHNMVTEWEKKESETLKNDLKNAKDLLQALTNRYHIIEKQLRFDLGGTALWVRGENEKFIETQIGQKVVMLQEKPTENGIIWPRSNGISEIRKKMKEVAGEERASLTFEEFLKKIWPEKTDKIPDKLKQECTGLKMWDIATGKTTVFNPFVSRTLLWGVNRNPLVGISSQIHVTGNPWHKIKKGIDKYGVQLNLEGVKLPQIIELLQHICDIDDKTALNKRNMGVPYALVCEDSDVEKLLQTASEHWYTAKVIGEITEDAGVQIQNVWIGGTTIDV